MESLAVVILTQGSVILLRVKGLTPPLAGSILVYTEIPHDI
jgi:hypothetical protein